MNKEPKPRAGNDGFEFDAGSTCPPPMKTAMQEFSEWLQAYEYELPLELQVKAKEALEREKEQIIRDFDNGAYAGTYAVDKDGEDYYNQTYNQEETLEEWKSKFTHHCAIKTNNL